jgi:predicted DNA-binding ribbon-helix-helix protein
MSSGGCGRDDAIRPTRPIKRSFTLSGHRTSVSLEEAFWLALREAAAEDGVGLAELVGRIDKGRGDAGLSSAIRVFVLERLRRRSQAPSVW